MDSLQTLRQHSILLRWNSTFSDIKVCYIISVVVCAPYNSNKQPQRDYHSLERRWVYFLSMSFRKQIVATTKFRYQTLFLVFLHLRQSHLCSNIIFCLFVFSFMLLISWFFFLCRRRHMPKSWMIDWHTVENTTGGIIRYYAGTSYFHRSTTLDKMFHSKSYLPPQPSQDVMAHILYILFYAVCLLRRWQSIASVSPSRIGSFWIHPLWGWRFYVYIYIYSYVYMYAFVSFNVSPWEWMFVTLDFCSLVWSTS